VSPFATVAHALYAATTSTAMEVKSVAVDVKAVRVMLAEGTVPRELTDTGFAGLYHRTACVFLKATKDSPAEPGMCVGVVQSR
jgi:hypothetical protein